MASFMDKIKGFLRSPQGRDTSAGERDDLDSAVGRGRAPFGVAGVFEVVDHRRHVRGVAVHRARQIPHGARVVGIDGQQGPQAGLGDPQFGGDLRPAPALT